MENNYVWINENKDWIKKELLEIVDGECKIKINDEIFYYKNYEICNDLKKIEEKDNLVDIPNLNEPEILDAVDKRYKKDIIYTYTGRILIAVNPFKSLNLFTEQLINEYKLHNNLKPHIYQIADKAYNNLLKLNKNQTILVSGESGAGKTYSVRNILKYLTCLSKNSSDIEKKVVESNPILEAFGNAKTLRNDNSSRFGKFIKVQIENYSIVGCKIDTYLLEKIRIINQSENERNFHIFYQLLSSKVKNKYLLSGFQDYNYLNNKYILCENVSDSDEFEITMEAFKVMGFSDVLIDNILKIVSSVLNIGNILFDDGGEIIENVYFENVLKLLCIKKEDLINCLCYRNLETVGEIIKIKMSKEECIKSRNSLSMKLYSCVFDFIVENINTSLKSNCNNFIGILDIFGFESFKLNSFEQFCINYTNETLQQQFNKYMFELEQKEYESEGVDWKNIEFPDNKECLSLIESKYGLIKMLDEECKLPRGSDKSFTNKILKKYVDSDFINSNKKFKDTKFIINHYAGEVEYDTVNFCEKNKDIVSDSIKQIVNSVSIINDTTKVTSKINMKTVIIQFKNQLTSLIKEISKTSSHYIRCIKPNDLNICDNFNRIRVNQQIKYSGILAAIKVSRAGYPIRFKKDMFQKRYSIINNIENYESLLQNISEKEYAIGNTKIFLKNDAYDNLEEKRKKVVIKKITLIQSKVRCFIMRKKYLNYLKNIVKCQSTIRILLAKKKLENLKKIKASIIIQKIFRCFKYKKIYKLIKFMVVKVQSYYRRNVAISYINLIRLKIKSAIKIQKMYRKIKLKIFKEKLKNEKYQWNKMVEKWNEVQEKTEISNILDGIIRKIIQINFENEKRLFNFNKELERKKIMEREKKLIQEKNKIKEMEKQLKEDNYKFNVSIKEKINEKISMMNDMEKLMRENMIMKQRLASQKMDKCVIS